MNEIKPIVEIAKKMGGSRGGEIQLEGRNAYVTNTKRTSLYHFIANSELGTGAFYANQAIINATEIVKRDDRVYFDWKGNRQQVFVPCLDSFEDDFKKRFETDYIDQKIVIPRKLFDVLQDILFTKLWIKDNTLFVSQIRSDATVGFKSEIKLSSALIEVDIPDAEEVSIFTSDLSILLPIVGSDVTIGFNGQKPLSLHLMYPDGKLSALIGTLEYSKEVEK